MTAIQELISRQHTNATIQERINNMAADGSLKLSDILFIADDAHKAWPQHDGVFTDDHGWKLAVMSRKVESGLGTAFEQGDIVMAQRPLWVGGDSKVYSVRNQCTTLVNGGVRFLI